MKDTFDEADIEINSTVIQLDEFIHGLVWGDMCKELEGWKDMVSSEYDEVDNQRDLGKIQGRKEALDYFLNLPRVLHETAKERQDDARRDKTE